MAKEATTTRRNRRSSSDSRKARHESSSKRHIILEEEIAAGIVAAKQIEARMVDVEQLRSEEQNEVVRLLRRDSHEVVDLLMDMLEVSVTSLGNMVRRAMMTTGSRAAEHGAGGNSPLLISTEPVKPGADCGSIHHPRQRQRVWGEHLRLPRLRPDRCRGSPDRSQCNRIRAAQAFPAARRLGRRPDLGHGSSGDASGGLFRSNPGEQARPVSRGPRRDRDVIGSQPSAARSRGAANMPATTSESRYRIVRSMLGRYQALTLESLRKVLPDKEPRRHLYDLVPSYLVRSAKGFRPGLCIATCRAFGGSVTDVLRSASVIELLHNAFLVHDDVEDESDLRRGWPTLSAEHGVAIAVNVGDAMNVLSIKTLAKNREILGSRLAWLILMEVEHMVCEAVEGQAMEVGWIRDNACTLTEDDYLRMVLKKTSWYTCICPCRIGSIVATRGSVQPDRFNRFGCYLGAAFQIQDDLLNLTGDGDLYGKEHGGDILEGKRTLILIHTMMHCDLKESRAPGSAVR